MQVALHILRKIIQTGQGGTFPNRNYFAVQVYERLYKYGIDYIKNKKFIDDIPVQAEIETLEDKGERIKTLEGSSVWDLRFRSFAIKGFRMFPDSQYYGLNFERTDSAVTDICSLFLVGANGSGKTSLYSSMEYFCTGNVSAAKSRGIMEDHYSDYITHAKSKQQPELKIFLKGGNKKESDEEQTKENKVEVLKSLRNVLPAFFCSEHEINEFCSKPENLTSFFYNQIGYNNIVKIKEHLEGEFEQLKEYIDNDIDTTKSEYQIHNTLKKYLLEHIQNDVLSFMNKPSNGQELSFFETVEFIGHLETQQVEWDDAWEIKRKHYILSRITPQLKKEREKIIKYLGRQIALLTLYDDFLESIENIQHTLSNKSESFVPKRFQRNEREFQMGKVEVSEFFAKRRYILEWYKKIFYQFSHIGKEKGTITVINEIGELLSKVDLHIDDISESKESIRFRYNAHRNHLKSLIDAIDEELNHVQEQILFNTESLKDKILSEFLLQSEEIRFGLSDKGKLFSTIFWKKNEEENEIPFQPREYFNSFRYKFYCILLKIVAAFTVKKNFNFNFPLIFDDIFYSSDFSNRDKVGDFISSIYLIHNEIFKGTNSPLQIIFFTHDDLILEAAIKGTSNFYNVMYGRLFFYNEVQNEDVKEVDAFKYYNLYVPFNQ